MCYYVQKTECVPAELLTSDSWHLMYAFVYIYYL